MKFVDKLQERYDHYHELFRSPRYREKAADTEEAIADKLGTPAHNCSFKILAFAFLSGLAIGCGRLWGGWFGGIVSIAGVVCGMIAVWMVDRTSKELAPVVFRHYAYDLMIAVRMRSDRKDKYSDLSSALYDAMRDAEPNSRQASELANAIELLGELRDMEKIEESLTSKQPWF